MSLANKKLSTTYGSLLNVDNSNTGVTSSLQTVKDGVGNTTAFKVSDRSCSITPGTNSTSAFLVENASGDDIFVVDATNKEAKVNGHYVNTQFKTFGVYDISPTAGNHYPLISSPSIYALGGSTHTSPSFGTGTDPDTSKTIGSLGYLYTPLYWYLHSNITIDAVFVIATAQGSTTANFHLFSYDLVTGSGSTAGDLSNGTLLAHNGSALTLDDDRVSTTTMTIDSADVASGKVILAFVENIGSTDDVTIQMEVKYHLNA